MPGDLSATQALRPKIIWVGCSIGYTAFYGTQRFSVSEPGPATTTLTYEHFWEIG